MNFFVPSLENDDPIQNKKNWDYIVNHYNNLIKKQFQLAYFSNIDQNATDYMPIHEFNVLYGILAEQLELEKGNQPRSS